MNTPPENPKSSIETLLGIGVKVFKQEVINNPGITNAQIAKLITSEVKEFCENNNYSFEEFKQYCIKYKINCGKIAFQQLSKSITSSFNVLHSNTLTLIQQGYSIENYIKLVKIKQEYTQSQIEIQQLRKSRVKYINQILMDERKKKCSLQSKPKNNSSSDVYY